MHCFFTNRRNVPSQFHCRFSRNPFRFWWQMPRVKTTTVNCKPKLFLARARGKKLIQTCSPFCGGLRTERSKGIFSFSVGGGTHQSGGDGGGGGGANEGTPPSPGGEEETDGRTDEGGKTFCARPSLPLSSGQPAFRPSDRRP